MQCSGHRVLRESRRVFDASEISNKHPIDEHVRVKLLQILRRPSIITPSSSCIYTDGRQSSPCPQAG